MGVNFLDYDIPEFMIFRPTSHRKSVAKYLKKQIIIILVYLISFQFI